MFKWIKNIFVEQKPGYITNGDKEMAVRIAETKDGFVITSRNGGQMTPFTYSRRRDAVRGAKRRGFVVA